jgi:polar amino acid transport system substrate-binding protein
MTTRMTYSVRAATALTAALLAAGLIGADSSRGAVPAPSPALRIPVAAPMADTSCNTAVSLPPAKNPDGAKIQQIRTRGTLIVGVDQNSYNWGYRNPLNGQIEGFDIDLARAIAASILGDPSKVTFKAVSTARRVDAVKNGEVDMVARTMTITCDRLKDIAFSTPYFRVSQSVVLPKATPFTSIPDALRGKRVCAADKSSSATELASGRQATAEVRIVENQLDYLVLMQLGKVDVTLADTSLAYAQAAQDPMVKVPHDTIVPAFMGVGMNKADPDLVAWVNQVLVDYRANGGWQASYDKWLAASMGDAKPYVP